MGDYFLFLFIESLDFEFVRILRFWVIVFCMFLFFFVNLVIFFSVGNFLFIVKICVFVELIY